MKERAAAIRLAKQAGILDHEWLQDQYDAIERLVMLAKYEEREECAAACEQIAMKHQQDEGSYAAGNEDGAFECAEAIRSRGEQSKKSEAS